MTPEQFNYYMQGAPQQLPTQMIGPNGKPVPPALIPLVQGIQRAIEQQRRKKMEEEQGARRQKHGYSAMSGPERNLAAMYARQARFMNNNPQFDNPNYYDESGRHFPVMGPDRILR